MYPRKNINRLPWTVLWTAKMLKCSKVAPAAGLWGVQVQTSAKFCYILVKQQFFFFAKSPILVPKRTHGQTFWPIERIGATIRIGREIRCLPKCVFYVSAILIWPFFLLLVRYPNVVFWILKGVGKSLRMEMLIGSFLSLTCPWNQQQTHSKINEQ